MVRCARSIAILLAGILVLLGGGEGLVLCIGDGGHVALETSFSACCGGGMAGPRSAGKIDATALSGPVAKESCDGCVDVTLSLCADRRASGPGKAAVPAPAIAAPPSAPFDLEIAAARPARESRPPDRLLDFLRTTVLLL